MQVRLEGLPLGTWVHSHAVAALKMGCSGSAAATCVVLLALQACQLCVRDSLELTRIHKVAN